MKINGVEIKIEIDWRQKSTIRGALWVMFGVIALVAYFITGNASAPGVVMSIGGSVVGGMGLMVKD